MNGAERNKVWEGLECLQMPNWILWRRHFVMRDYYISLMKFDWRKDLEKKRTKFMRIAVGKIRRIKMLEPLKTVKELIDMSGLTRSEISRRTGISDKSLCEYYHGKWEPRWYNYTLIYDVVRKELSDGSSEVRQGQSS